MPLIDWSDELALGCKEIDKDHRQLVGLLNDLNDAVSNRAKGEIEETISDLIDFAAWHFGQEERLMMESGFPAPDDHLREHDELTDASVAALTRHRQGDDTALSGFLPLLIDRLAAHFNGQDKKLADFLARLS